MKDCYKVSRNVQVCGTLDYNDNNEKVIVVDTSKEGKCTVIDFDALMDSLVGQQISIKSEDVLDV